MEAGRMPHQAGCSHGSYAIPRPVWATLARKRPLRWVDSITRDDLEDAIDGPRDVSRAVCPSLPTDGDAAWSRAPCSVPSSGWAQPRAPETLVAGSLYAVVRGMEAISTRLRC